MCANNEAHKHKCGFNMLPPDPLEHAFGLRPRGKDGCGHVWDCSGVNHDCPECGEGPWLWKYDEDTIERQKLFNPEGL